MLEYTALPFESNRSITEQTSAAGAFTDAVPKTLSCTWKICSAALAVTGRVVGLAGEALITTSLLLTTRTDAAHTLESHVSAPIASWLALVLTITRNVLTEYVPGNANTEAVKLLPANKSRSGMTTVAPITAGRAGSATMSTVPSEAGPVTPTSEYETAAVMFVPPPNHAPGTVILTEHSPLTLDGTQLPPTVDPPIVKFA